ncbi:MAG: hypothetical protein H0X69_05730 [Gemmatimonadales bacterium]|nr:hypothetical protein [Gemmatimonadales bacterium]
MAARRSALGQSATELNQEAEGADDPAKVRMLAEVLKQLAAEPRLAQGR